MSLDDVYWGLSVRKRRALLKPGERAYALMPDGTKLVIVGRVEGDGLNRQQRRALEREMVLPVEVPSGE